MARKTAQFRVSDTGRDQGKVFVITEMPASQAEKWAMRAFLSMAQSGVELPEGITDLGFAGIVRMGMNAIAMIPFQQAEPLMDEMMGCVQMMPNPSNPSIVRPLVEDDIEEIATRLKIRAQVLSLHSGFSIGGGQSTSAPSPA
ncbi:hypothetical protein [Pseudomonas sp. HS-18]|uniref:hypothetical protein n=1 Tax=Pseudomonas sp. HS-18 TaxID=2879114 RepID=UPI001CEFC2B9|nr:hypothetical protein [Pseudomonas sp. HS-18]UCL84496.1 hypothetical protein LDJ84_16085 [Pseudomonas sp. HS-18]